MADNKYYYAGFLRRLAAFVIDSIIFLVGYSIIRFAVLQAIGMDIADTDNKDYNVLLTIIDVLVGILYLAYYAVQEKKYGATLGKRVLRLSVIDYSGHNLGYFQAIRRNVFKYLFGALLFAVAKIIGTVILSDVLKLFGQIAIIVGYLSIIWTKQKQGLYDMLACTLVVRKK